MIATCGFMAASECTKFVFGWISFCHSDSTGGAYSAPQTHQLVWGGPDSKGRGSRGKWRENGTGEGKGVTPPPFANSWIRP